MKKYKSVEEASLSYLNAMPPIPHGERRRMQAAFFCGAMSAFSIDEAIEADAVSGKIAVAEGVEQLMKVRKEAFELIQQRAKEAQERLRKQGYFSAGQ